MYNIWKRNVRRIVRFLSYTRMSDSHAHHFQIRWDIHESTKEVDTGASVEGKHTSDNRLDQSLASSRRHTHGHCTWLQMAVAYWQICNCRCHSQELPTERNVTHYASLTCFASPNARTLGYELDIKESTICFRDKYKVDYSLNVRDGH